MNKTTWMTSLAFAATALAAAPAQAAGPWSGLYLGGHVGGMWGDIDTTVVSETTAFYNFAPASTFDFGVDGVLGGAQLGYNFQMSQWVFGVELSGSAHDYDDTRRRGFDDFISVESEWSAAASARVGFAFNDRSMIYVKGGYAMGNVQHSVRDSGGGNTGTFSSDENHGGYTVGGGFEHMLSSDVSFGLEYAYTDLGEDQHTGNVAAPGVGAATHDVDSTSHTVSARLNWHWNPSF